MPAVWSKNSSLGGEPPADVASFGSISPSTAGIETLIDYENEALDAVHAVIPETGQEARSEALEHLLEHIIMRKQAQIDFLLRITR